MVKICLFIMLAVYAEPMGGLLPEFEMQRSILAPHIRLALEFSKPNIVSGEAVTAEFVLYSNRPFEEIEVARFPEFDGFWAENTALRQGRLILTPLGKNRFKVLVGSYTIMPVTTRDNPMIDSMHLIVRGIDKPLLSEGKLLPIKRLPKHSSLTNAVGQLTTSFDTQQSFYPDQPMTIRVSVQGEGNFPEFEAPELPFPKSVELVTKRTSIMGGGSFATKSFEYTFISHQVNELTLPEIPFWYFNTRRARYESLPIGPIRLIPIIAPPSQMPIAVTPASGQSANTLLKNPIVIAINSLFLAFIVWLGWRSRRRNSDTPASERSKITITNTTNAPPVEEPILPIPIGHPFDHLADHRVDWEEKFEQAITANDFDKAIHTLANWIRERIGTHHSTQARSEDVKGLPAILLECDAILYSRNKVFSANARELSERAKRAALIAKGADGAVAVAH